MSDLLLAPTFLFRYCIPCLHYNKPWDGKKLSLGEAYRMPSFGELEGRAMFADLRMGWSPAGLTLSLRVSGKIQAPWCRDTRIDDSDCLQLFIDTRDTHSIHRASRFCHRFLFLPSGAGRRLDQPLATLLPIMRSRELPKPIPADLLKVRSEKRIDGYLLEAFIAAAAMTGFDSGEHSRLGFNYAVVDRELGWQTLSIGPEFPITEDPSLWGTLELTPDDK